MAMIAGLLLFALFKVIKNKKFILVISLLVLMVSLILPFVVKAPQEIDEPGKNELYCSAKKYYYRIYLAKLDDKCGRRQLNI